MSSAAAPSAMPAAATPLESMFMVPKSGTLDGRNAGQSLAATAGSTSVKRSRCTRTGGVLRSTRSEPTPWRAAMPVELVGRAAGQAGQRHRRDDQQAALGDVAC